MRRTLTTSVLTAIFLMAMSLPLPGGPAAERGIVDAAGAYVQPMSPLSCYTYDEQGGWGWALRCYYDLLMLQDDYEWTWL
ncbi:MAG: hypothetical protein R6X25_10965 [Candidatus Krumholzibacteriia bacterium]